MESCSWSNFVDCAGCEGILASWHYNNDKTRIVT